MLRNVKRVSVNVLLWLLSDWCVFFFITLGFTATLGWQGPARATPTVSEGPLRPKPPPARAWWLKALSARVVRAAPNDEGADHMRANVLRGGDGAWEAGPRSAAELKEAATHYEQAAALCPAPAMKAILTGDAEWCCRQADAM